MKILILKLIRYVGLLALGIALAWAQESSPTQSAMFRTLGCSSAANGLYYDCNGVQTKVAVTDSARSGFYKFTEGGQIVFYRLAYDADGKSNHELVAKVSTTKAGGMPLLIFVNETAADNNKYSVTALADDFQRFPFPSTRFINQTSLPLDVKHGDKSFTLAAHGDEIVGLPHKEEAASETRYTKISALTPKGALVLYSKNWVMSPTQRTLVLISGKEDDLQVEKIVDDSGQYTVSSASPR